MNVINGSAFAGALGSRQRGLLQEPVVSRFIKPTPNRAHAAARDDDDGDGDAAAREDDDGDDDDGDGDDVDPHDEDKTISQPMLSLSRFIKPALKIV